MTSHPGSLAESRWRLSAIKWIGKRIMGTNQMIKAMGIFGE